MVFRTVRSLGSSLTTFSYSLMAFCSLPCCTAFSADARTFCLLNPKPSAIGPVLPAYLKFISARADVPLGIKSSAPSWGCGSKRKRETPRTLAVPVVAAPEGRSYLGLVVKYHKYVDFLNDY